MTLPSVIFLAFKSKKVIPAFVATNVQFSTTISRLPFIELTPVINAFVISLAWKVEFLNSKACIGASCLVERPNKPLLPEFKPKTRQLSMQTLSTICFWAASTSWYHIVRCKSLISQFFHEIVPTWNFWFFSLKKSCASTFITKFSKWSSSIRFSLSILKLDFNSNTARSSPALGSCPTIESPFGILSNVLDVNW